MTYAQRAREIIGIELAGLTKVLEGLSTEFDRAAELMLHRLQEGGKVVVTGVGKSLHIGQKISATFTSTGTPSVTLHPSEAMHGDLGLLAKDDVLLALSFSGESEELLHLIPIARRIGVGVVAVTGNLTNGLAHLADEVIPIPIEREACPFNMAPTTSTMATLAVGDALAVVLLEARGFKKEDYAKLHPGGTIGRTLLMQVGDIMRTGDRLAKVRGGSKVKDAVLAMTSARSGAVAIVDRENKLLGVFTDGDLRRHITETSNLTDMAVDEVMTRNPVTLTANHLAVDVLRLYEKHNVDDLVIVDQEQHVVGLVDIQDLPKLKIL